MLLYVSFHVVSDAFVWYLRCGKQWCHLTKVFFGAHLTVFEVIVPLIRDRYVDLLNKMQILFYRVNFIQIENVFYLMKSKLLTSNAPKILSSFKA